MPLADGFIVEVLCLNQMVTVKPLGYLGHKTPFYM